MRLPVQLHESLRMEPLQAAGSEVNIGIVSQVKRPMAVQIQLLREILIAQADNFSLPENP
ncbi:hypothetical protein [Aliamphritea spongicola]|nr:hypothetical protein [Aliamphritea spongicola]